MGFLSSLIGGVVGFFVGGPVGAVIGAGLGATKVGEKIVNSVMDFVLQPFMPSMPDVGGGDEASRQQGVLVQTQGSTVNIPVVYGYRKVGGTVVFAETGSTNNKYLYVAYVFSEGLVEGLREVYIDDWLLPVGQVGELNAGQLVTVNADRYKDRVQLRWFPGVYYSDPRGSSVGTTVKGDIFAEAPSFVSDMVYNGQAVLFARYEWKEVKTQSDADNNPFNGSLPQVQVSMLGKRVASLLVDDTEQSSYDANLVRYSTNPAECLLDYLRNPRYGKGLLNADIDWTTWKRAARKCNQTVTYVASGIQGPILTLNMVIDTSATLMSNTKTILQNFRAYMPYVQGKYKLRIEDAGNEVDILSGSATIVQTFTKDDIVSDVTFNGIERSAKYNVVSVTYVDPDQKFSNQQVVYPETEEERQQYINIDGGRENKQEITFGGITNYAIAKDFARLLFNKSRRQESCVFTATSKALELEPGDIIAIQSNLLDFGLDPWRVVSIKINNDMTVDLGCVRNPDDIYPYVRVGEQDYVVPTYVPKGSIIYFPSSDNRVPLGLVPPIYAVFPPSAAPVSSNPPPTNPDGILGGGVGGGSPNGGSAGPAGISPSVPVSSTNVPARPVPVPPPWSAVLSLKNSRAIKQSTGGYLYQLTFTQPNDALYSKSTLWWRPNFSSPWTSVEITDRPGAGLDITWSLGPLPAGQYDFYVRSYASNGDASAQVLKGVISVAPNAAELNPNLTGIASALPTAVTAGWTVPTTVTSAPRYDDEIELIEIKPKLVGNEIQDPRRMTVTLSQLVSTYGKVFNFGIQGIRIYYKYTTDTYYSYEDFNFETLDAPYYIGKTLTFDLAGDFGAKGTVNAQNYTFAAKLLYKDGKAATKILGPATAPVETYIGRNNFVAWGTSSGAAAGVKSLDIPASLNIQTTESDPNRSFTTGSDFVPIITTIRANPTLSQLTWTFTPPSNNISKFRGYKIRYRTIVPGAKTAFNEIKIGPTVDSSGKVIFNLREATYSHGNSYEFAVTAQYSNNGTVSDCTKTLYAKGVNIPFGNYDLNLFDKFSFVEISTEQALGLLVTSFPASPAIVASSWSKIQPRPSGSSGQITASTFANADSSDVFKLNASSYYHNRWYRLKFSAPSGYGQLVVYRRVFDQTASQKPLGSTAKYYGLGAWEKVVITMPAADVEGFRTVNVRGPLDPALFDATYQINASATLFKPYYGPAGKYPSGGTITDVYPYYGAGNTQNTGTPTKYVEFLFVLANSGVEQNKALRLRDFYAATSGGEFKTQSEGFGAANVVNNEVVTVTNYNNYDSGFKRNINEAITGVTAAALMAGVNPIYPPNSSGVPNSTNFGQSYTVFLNALAEDGTTVIY